MTLFILKRHPPTESDLTEEVAKKKLKGTLENEGTRLRWPESYLYPYYFARRLKELIPEESSDLVLVHGGLVRTEEDAKATSIALELLGVRHEIREEEYLRERDFGDLADKEYEQILKACGSQGILHALFYAEDYKELMQKSGIKEENYGEPFGEFIRNTVEGLISLWRIYKKPNDIIVQHTHSLRHVAMLNVLHYIGYKSFKDDKLTEAIFDSTEPLEGILNKAAKFGPKSGYWWKDINYGEYLIINARRDGPYIYVTETQPPSVGVYVRSNVQERPAVTDRSNPLQKFTDPEIEYLNRVKDFLEKDQKAK